MNASDVSFLDNVLLLKEKVEKIRSKGNFGTLGPQKFAPIPSSFLITLPHSFQATKLPPSRLYFCFSHTTRNARHAKLDTRNSTRETLPCLR